MKIEEGLKKKYPRNIHVVLCKKRGLGKAYITGFQYVLKNIKGNLICEMDADLSHNPKYLIKFLDLIKKYDVVIGSRYIKGGGHKNWNWSRKMVSKFGNVLGRPATQFKIWDVTAGYRMYRRNVIENLNLEEIKSDGYAFQLEILVKLVNKGYTVKEFPIIFEDRKKGRSKLRNIDVLQYLKLAIKYALEF